MTNGTPSNVQVLSLKNNGRKIMYYVVAITAINIILWFVAFKSNTENPSLATILSSGFKKLGILYVGIFIGGLALGLFVSLIPFKQLKFSQKFFRSFMLSILALSVLLLFFIIRSLIIF